MGVVGDAAGQMKTEEEKERAKKKKREEDKVGAPPLMLCLKSDAGPQRCPRPTWPLHIHTWVAPISGIGMCDRGSDRIAVRPYTA